MTDRERAAGSSAVLLDLDGTLCRLFAHTDLDPLRRSVAALLRTRGWGDLCEGDVFTAPARLTAASGHGVGAGPTRVPAPVRELAGRSGAVGPPRPVSGDAALVEEIGALLTEVELRAADTAPLVAGAEEVVTGWVTAGRPVAVVTNNCPACVGRLARRCLPALAQVPVVGRDPRHPDWAKPDPGGVRQALIRLGRVAPTETRSAVMVGDSLSDLAAARAAGCRFIGMGSTPTKRTRLEAAVSSGAVVTDFHELRMCLA